MLWQYSIKLFNLTKSTILLFYGLMRVSQYCVQHFECMCTILCVWPGVAFSWISLTFCKFLISLTNSKITWLFPDLSECPGCYRVYIVSWEQHLKPDTPVYSKIRCSSRRDNFPKQVFNAEISAISFLLGATDKDQTLLIQKYISDRLVSNKTTRLVLSYIINNIGSPPLPSSILWHKRISYRLN